MPTIDDILYRSGDVFLPEPVRKTLEKGVYFDNREALYINGWTGVHFLSGFIAGWLYLKYLRNRTNIKR